MSLVNAARIARRELRGGTRGFGILIVCLALGVAAIAAIGSVRASIEGGLAREGATLLGGDAEVRFTYRFADVDERAWMEARALAVSEIAEFRSMAAAADGRRGLTQVKAVDDAYPLVGAVRLEPAMPLATAFAGRDGLPGAVLHPALAQRLEAAPGDRISIGGVDFVMAATLQFEPDDAGAGLALGPRSLVSRAALEGTALLQTGSLFDTHYRLRLGPEVSLPALKAGAEARFTDTGGRWRDRRNGAPGLRSFVERIGAFLVLVGLAGMAVGGVGVSAAVRAYLDGKTAVIATLKSLGADRRTVFAAYLMQIGAMTLAGIVAGLGLGVAITLAAAPLIRGLLPVPVETGVYVLPLAEAAFYGLVTAATFTLWPLSRAEAVRAAVLFRDSANERTGWPRLPTLIATALLIGILTAGAMAFSGLATLAVWTIAGIGTAFVVLVAAAALIRRVARSAAARVRGRPGLRAALASMGSARGEATPVVLSIGLGLTVLATVGQTDANLRAAIARDLPDVAPAFFFIDIQPDQLQPFLDRTRGDPGVSRVDTAPMLRGIITRINDRPAREVAGDHWVLRGDRGVTFGDDPGPSPVTEGQLWQAGYDGPPQISFAAEEGAEMGLKLGDRLTVNILGRDIEAEITSFRAVDFSTAGIGFVILMNPAALRGAPHTSIATVYAEEASEAGLVADIARDAPNVTAIRVRDAIDRVAAALGSLAAVTAYGASATLATGFAVLIGAAAAGQSARVYEAAVLKTLGATRLQVMASFALRSALLGAAASLVAVVAGAVASWAVMTFVMDSSYAFEPVSALMIVGGGALLTLLAALGFMVAPLARRPAGVLRSAE